MNSVAPQSAVSKMRRFRSIFRSILMPLLVVGIFAAVIYAPFLLQDHFPGAFHTLQERLKAQSGTLVITNTVLCCLFLVLFSVGSLYGVFKKEIPPLTALAIQSGLFLIVGGGGYLTHYLLLDVFPNNPWTKLFGHVFLGFGRPLAFVTIISFTALMYVLKRLYKAWYGVLEMITALIGQWKFVWDVMPGNLSSHVSARFLALIASLYVLSSGIGNTVEGIEEWQNPARKTIRQILIGEEKIPS